MNVLRLLCLSFLALMLAACSPGESKPSFKGTDITGAEFGGDFTLTGHDGKPHALSAYRGKVVALFFGYTHCPDICPTTMLEYAQVSKLLGDKAKDLQVLFISVDPQRDTPALLAGYVPHFNTSFVGLTGSQVDIDKVTSHYKVIAQKQGVQDSKNYTVDHSAGSYLLDREGKLSVYLPYGTAAADIAHDVQSLMK